MGLVGEGIRLYRAEGVVTGILEEREAEELGGFDGIMKARSWEARRGLASRRGTGVRVVGSWGVVIASSGVSLLPSLCWFSRSSVQARLVLHNSISISRDGGEKPEWPSLSSRLAQVNQDNTST